MWYRIWNIWRKELTDGMRDRKAVTQALLIPLIVGITGLDASRHAAIRSFSERRAVLVAPNMSLAVNLLFGLAGRAAAALPADYDVEILEAHHRGKADAPSGTAVRLGEIVAGARGGTLAEHAVYGRLGNTGDPRAAAELNGRPPAKERRGGGRGRCGGVDR